jgi:hypothetical protein
MDCRLCLVVDFVWLRPEVCAPPNADVCRNRLLGCQIQLLDSSRAMPPAWHADVASPVSADATLFPVGLRPTLPRRVRLLHHWDAAVATSVVDEKWTTSADATVAAALLPRGPGVVRRTAGVYVPFDAFLALSPVPPLVNRAVFVVCTVHTAAVAADRPFRTVLAMRRQPDQHGNVLLRVDGNAQMVNYLYSDGVGWAAHSYGTGALVLDVPQVWGFQIRVNQAGVVNGYPIGPSFNVRYIPNGGAATVGVWNAGTTRKPNDGGGPAELTLGGYRAAGDAAAETGGCTLHEVLLTEDLREDGDLVAIYQSLMGKWTM